MFNVREKETKFLRLDPWKFDRKKSPGWRENYAQRGGQVEEQMRWVNGEEDSHIQLTVFTNKICFVFFYDFGHSTVVDVNTTIQCVHTAFDLVRRFGPCNRLCSGSRRLWRLQPDRNKRSVR
jgi:hypothetical protein